jgi:hypothetical protein
MVFMALGGQASKLQPPKNFNCTSCFESNRGNRGGKDVKAQWTQKGTEHNVARCWHKRAYTLLHDVYCMGGTRKLDALEGSQAASLKPIRQILQFWAITVEDIGRSRKKVPNHFLHCFLCLGRFLAEQAEQGHSLALWVNDGESWFQLRKSRRKRQVPEFSP